MERIAKPLLGFYRNRAVCPVIVKAAPNRFDDIRVMLRQIVPVDLLEPTFHMLPRVFRIFTVPLSKWKEIRTFSMIGTVLTPKLVEEVAQWREVEKVYPDFVKWALEYPTVPPEGIWRTPKMEPFTTTYYTKRLLGLDRANSQGYTGKGVRTVVIDTGCRKTLPQVRHVKVRTAMPEKGGTGLDANGHGVWCCSCVFGRSATDWRYRAPVEGMAPEADAWSIQALGFIIGCGMTSDILQAMEMCIQLGAKVVSMSLGSEDAPPDSENPEAEAINALVENNILPVVAAGNSGPEPETIGSPGSCLNSITVGAVSPITGGICDFSSRGPTAGDGYIKPDVVSYGHMIDSQCTGLIDHMTDLTQKAYAPISGTSMATPHVAGLVTCMAQLYRDKVGKELTVDEFKRMCEELGHEKNCDDGWGLVTWDWVEMWVETEYGVKP